MKERKKKMMIPDCRTDETYNQKYLKDADAEFISGFDYCVEEAVDNFFNNDMFGLQDEDGYLGHILCEKLPASLMAEYEDDRIGEGTKITTYADLIHIKLLEWIEMSRDELVVSILEGYGDDEYQKIKEKVDGQCSKEN